MINQLEEKDAEIMQKDKQLEVYYTQINQFEQEKLSIKNEGEKNNIELQDFKKKMDELIKFNEELQQENSDLKKEYFFT